MDEKRNVEVNKHFLPKCIGQEDQKCDEIPKITELNQKYFDVYLEFDQKFTAERVIDSLDGHIKKLEKLIFWSGVFADSDIKINIDFKGIGDGLKLTYKILVDYKKLLLIVTSPCFEEKNLLYANKIFYKLKQDGLKDAIKYMTIIDRSGLINDGGKQR